MDNGHKTDILISDGPEYYRVQVKTIEAKDENQEIENRWKESYVDVVVVFARNRTWGYVMPAFSANRRKINDESHQRFESNSRNEFLRTLHKVDIP